MTRLRRRILIWTSIFFLILFIAGFVFVKMIDSMIQKSLPEFLQAKTISTSLLQSVIRVDDLKLLSSPACNSLPMIEATILQSAFSLQRRTVSSVKIDRADIFLDRIQKHCMPQLKENDKSMPLDYIGKQGMDLIIENAILHISNHQKLLFTAHLRILPQTDKSYRIDHQSFRVDYHGLIVKMQRGSMVVVPPQEPNGNFQKYGSATFRIESNALEKIPGINSEKLQLVKGAIQATADLVVGYSEVALSGDVHLLNVKVQGNPLIQSPLSFFRLTPDALWPLAEDSPGKFNFIFKANGRQDQIIELTGKAIRQAITAKVKANIRKKIPLPIF